MTREAEEREKGLRRDLEQLRSQQQQTLGTLDTRIDAMMKRRNHAIMDRLNCATCISTDHHLSACPTYKQGMKAIGFSVRGVIAKLGHRWAFFCASPEESCFANPEGFHFGGVLFLAIRKGHILPIWRGPNSEGSSFYQYVRVKFCQSGGVPIRRGPVFTNPKGSSFAIPEGSQFEGVLSVPVRKSHVLPIWRGPNSEGSCFCQSKRVIFCQSGGVPIRRGPVCASPEESCFANLERSKFGEVLFLPIR